MAQQDQPFNDLDNELQAIPPNADPEVAYIRLRYDWSAEKAIDPQRWQLHLLAFRGEDAYSAVLDDIADYVHDRLARLEQTLCNRLDEENACIIFQLTVQSSDKLKRHACRVDTSNVSRLESIEDLYAGDLRPELRVLLARKEEKTRDVNSARLRVKIRTRDAAVPFAEDDPDLNGQLEYKFWDFSQLRPIIPTFPINDERRIEVTCRFVQHLEPSETAKSDFELYTRTWRPQGMSYTRLRKVVIKELCRQSGSEAPFCDPYFLGDNCDLEFWVQPQGYGDVLYRLRPDENVHRVFAQERIDRKHASLEVHMQFWVLPQVPDGRTLYRYSSGKAELYNFLNKSDVEEGDLSLFMEVHIIDKDAEPSRETRKEASRRAGLR